MYIVKIQNRIASPKHQDIWKYIELQQKHEQHIPRLEPVSVYEPRLQCVCQQGWRKGKHVGGPSTIWTHCGHSGHESVHSIRIFPHLGEESWNIQDGLKLDHNPPSLHPSLPTAIMYTSQ